MRKACLVAVVAAAFGLIGSFAPSDASTPAAVPPAGTHLRIAVSHHWVTYGQRVIATTKLTDVATGDPIVGAQVSFSWEETDAVFNVLGTTSQDGTASITIKPFNNTSVWSDFAGSDTEGSSMSAQDPIHVRQAVGIHSPAETHGAATGQRILLWGTVAPGYYGMVLPIPAHYVYVEWHNATGWHSQARVKLMDQRLPNGKNGFGYAVRLVPKGRHLRVVAPRTGFNERGASRTIYIPRVPPIVVNGI